MYGKDAWGGYTPPILMHRWWGGLTPPHRETSGAAALVGGVYPPQAHDKTWCSWRSDIFCCRAVLPPGERTWCGCGG